jgi:hypothetical protein
MDKLSPDLILYAFLFLIPGFLTAFWINLFVPLRPGSDHKNTLTYILWSAALALPWILFQGWHGRLSYFHSFKELASFITFLMIAPFLAALLLSKVINNPERYPWKAFHKVFRVRTIHPIPSAWDKTFMEIEDSWILVTLKDGTKVGGIWDAKASASSDPTERDVFIRRPYQVDTEGNWTETPDSLGMLLKADQLALIEFFKYPNESKEIEHAD